jgi:hypothetical protein
MLADKRNEGGDGEQSSQGVPDFPLRPIARPIGRKGIDRPSIDRLVDRLIENKEVDEHRRITKCRYEGGAPRVTVMPSHDKQGERGKERQDFHRPERLSPPTIEMLLDAEPQRAIQFELRDHLKRMRHGRGGGDEGDDQIDRSQRAHTTSGLRTEPPRFQNQPLKLAWGGQRIRPHKAEPYVSTISSDNSFAFAEVLGKCAASTLPTSLMASVSA